MSCFFRTYGPILAGLLFTASLYGQDMQFSQPYSNPLYLNPAFAGSAKNTRVVLNYRKQWPGIQHEYNAFAASTDFFLKASNGGLGVTVLKDIAGINRLSNTMASLYYSQHLRLSRKSDLALGIKGTLGQRAFDPANILFADQVIREAPTSLTQLGLTESTAYADFSAGLLYYNDKAWLGVSVHRINEPNQALGGGIDIIPRKLSVHGGTEIPIESFKNSLGAKKLRVAFNYKQQGDWNQLDLGGFFTYKNVNFGTWYRGLPFKPYKPGYANNESLIFLIGYEAPKNFAFGYSYDISINRLFGHSGGAHEISTIITFHSPKKQKRRIVPCAKF